MRWTCVILSLGLIILLGCRKKEAPLSWNSGYMVPLVHGSLGIEDLIPDTLVSVDVDSSILLRYEGELLNLDLTEILTIPDTVMRDTFLVPFPSQVNLSPGQVFINIPEEQELALQGVSLSQAKLFSGTVDYQLESTVQGDVTYTYEIPSATDWMGNIFRKTITVPAASSGSVSLQTGSFSLDGYYLDMQGQSGVEYNKVLTTINCKIAESNSSDVSVSSSDKIIVANEFKDVVIEEAEGYFGQHTISTGLNFATFSGFSKWVSGSIDIEDLELNLTLKNGLGIDAFLRINQLLSQGVNSTVSLSHSIIGELITLSRASRYYDSIVPSVYETHLNASNSNVDNFLESLPQEVEYDIEVEVNPLGNVSGYNDFYDMDAPIGVFLDASMPLSLIANNLTLQDTLTIDLSGAASVNEVTLLLEIMNGLPLQANVEIGVLDANDKVVSRIFSPNVVPSALVGSDGKVSSSSSSEHEVLIDSQDMSRIRENGRLLLTVVFDSPGNQHVKIYNSYRLAYSVKADASITITTGDD
ncbi:hypothetical protein [Parvicella tangerina]|uniref:Uncharacterized protein n=1 Tax=Parvicella tangerina TaxID=2829795 RepID=A0A916JLB0_9FLAO|nr:hypothetical protein [Parvicella tangerina]CAG5078625.1 hypothetical protein CRYO30217_00724 [Parvicella tangerina]